MIETLFEMQADTMIASLIASLFAIVFALTVHEFAHALVATKLGDTTPRIQGRLTLNPIKHIDPLGFVLLMILGFGWAKPVEVNPHLFKNYRKGLFLTCMAGPLTNIICAFFASLLWLLCGKFFAFTNFASVLLTSFCMYFTMYNLILALFNLIPIYPLDGFKMLMSVLKRGSGYLKFNVKYGTWLLLAVAVFGGTYIFTGANLLAGYFKMFWELIF